MAKLQVGKLVGQHGVAFVAVQQAEQSRDTTTPPERTPRVYANGLGEARTWVTGPPLDPGSNSAAATAVLMASREFALAAAAASQPRRSR